MERASAEQQEAVIGRRKFDGVEHDILRDKMPFGSPATQFGTYFIGYSRRLWVIEKTLERMFIRDPPGLHDRLLDFSTPLTGSRNRMP